MEEEIENPTSAAAEEFPDDMDSCCSTPYVSAPSSPGRGTHLAGFYYSAPASPMHFVLSSTALKSYPSAAAAAADASCSFEFDFSATLPSTAATSPEHMTSADELFFNGQIRPMKLSTHLQRPQLLDPLIESDDAFEDDQAPFALRGRDLKLRAGSLRRRTRSMSPMRSQTTPFDDSNAEDVKSGEIHHACASADAEEEKGAEEEATPCASRSSSAGRSSKRWVFLKEFLYRSKSEGRNEGHKFWGSLSFSPVNKEKKMAPITKVKEGKKKAANKNEGGKRRVVSPSAHELHYAAKRAQAEEMRKKTFLPYRQGLLGCLGFSSKGYGAMNGFARAFTTVSSR
ncbi:hypothetical protein C2S52_004662 [Perilla frutescens var. hirtella]|nr:hypothetical protein C2S51_010942 [Perilla frutescens var. frutescens]KAH6794185.1 hypothetical protein C2S52_004662 [Perilla frutescens var. hirtella]